MSVIFQLFSAGDLQKLDEGQLEALRQLVIAALAPSLQVREKLKPRADEVFRQLASPPMDDPLLLPDPPPALPNPEYPLSHQLFRGVDLDRLDADATKRKDKLTILEWAILCERDRSAYVLEVIMQEAYTWYTQQLPGPPPSVPTPDAVYSPFSNAYKITRALNPPENLSLVEREWPW
jgi:hypothetical protein